MKSKDSRIDGCAKLLRDLRSKSGLSVSKMADAMMIDRRKWQKYEDEKASPTVPEFLKFYEIMHECALKPVLDFIYPDVYSNVYPGTEDIDSIRKSAAHYIMNVAPDRLVRELDFIFFSQVGDTYAKMQEYTMLNHLPLTCRYVIGTNVASMYQIIRDENRLIRTECVMPDEDAFYLALNRCREAGLSGEKSYTIFK